MKISAVPSLGNSVAGVEGQGSKVETLRALKMSTNATPGPAGPQAAQELLISDDNRNNEDPKVVEEVTQPLSAQAAAFARQRRALQVKERELADREKALSSQSQGSDRIDIARLKSEPLNVLLEAGVTYDQLTEAILANQGNSEVNALKTKISELEQGIEKKFSDRETQAEQQVLAEMKRDATKLAAEGETFEMVRETGSIPDVMQLIERTYRETGEVLDVREACQLVEEELVNRYSKLANLKKLQAKLASSVQQSPQRQGMRTLTNRDTASVPMSAKARAIAAFHGTLKK